MQQSKHLRCQSFVSGKIRGQMHTKPAKVGPTPTPELKKHAKVPSLHGLPPGVTSARLGALDYARTQAANASFCYTWVIGSHFSLTMKSNLAYDFLIAFLPVTVECLLPLCADHLTPYGYRAKEFVCFTAG
jgi:hypothetical protein